MGKRPPADATSKGSRPTRGVSPDRPGATSGGDRPGPRGGRRGRRIDLVIVLLLAAACLVVYANAVGGKFVYDDDRQIVLNTLIQDGRYFWKALASDVWAFRGSGEEAVSNYWRPAFIVWLMINYRLFGLGNTAGWHLLNIALHALVVGLVYALGRKLGIARPACAAIGLLFAVHPAHVESVAWISGSPDLLLAVGMLGSLWFVLDDIERPARLKVAAAILLYAIAQLSKEAAIFFPLIVMLAVATSDGRPGDLTQRLRGGDVDPARRLRGGTAGVAEGLWGGPLKLRELFRRGALKAAPFAVLGVVYFIARLLVVGQVTRELEDAPSAGSMLLTAPAIAAFYLRQIVFPVWIGPSYPLRAVTAGKIDLANFFLPVLVAAALGAFALFRARRSRIAAIGLALFALPLLPAFNIKAFISEQLVHDRYLYLPLLGFLLMLVPESVLETTRGDVGTRGVSAGGSGGGGDRAGSAGRQTLGGAAKSDLDSGGALRPAWVVLAIAAALSLPLAAQTRLYNTAWLSDLALWEWGIQTDPTSSFNSSQLAVYLQEEGRFSEARAAFDRAIAIRPITSAHLGRAEVDIALKKYSEAEADLKTVLAQHPDNLMAYERLAICYERQSRLDEAVATLRQARSMIPHRKCMLTEMLSVVLYQAGKKADALRELESVRRDVLGELDPGARMVLYRMGLLYQDAGRKAEATGAFREYLDLTHDLSDPRTLQTRAEVQGILGKM